MLYSQPHISMLDTTSQAIAVADTPQVITFNTTVVNHKIAVTSSSRFTVNEAGGYIVAMTVQIEGTGANKVLDLWLRINGTDVTNSNTKTAIVNTNDQKMFTIERYVELTAGQYIEAWISGDSTTLSLLSTAAGVTPTRPLTPSVFMSLIRIHP